MTGNEKILIVNDPDGYLGRMIQAGIWLFHLPCSASVDNMVGEDGVAFQKIV